MSAFGRKFNLNYLNTELKGNSWFTDVLSRWIPSGEAIDDRSTAMANDHLRLAIRNGYLNFYRAGQSVARVCFARGGKLQAKIHIKYIDRFGTSQEYLTLDSSGLCRRDTAAPSPYNDTLLRKWISNANSYTSEEKRFVDHVVARNSNVIDLEMGLPAYSPNERVAPRMDLVVLEPAITGWRLVFWEAKLAGDGRARCSGPAIPGCRPEVLRQLRDYTNWLRHSGHCALVVEAYRKVCKLFVEFHQLPSHCNPSIGRLGPGIRDVAGGAPLAIDEKPRLLIDNRNENASFEANGHLQKLRDAGVHVQVVQTSEQMTLETFH